MRLLHLIPYMHPSAGGPPVVVDEWCTQLRAHGHDVEVLTTDAFSNPRDTHWQASPRSRFGLTVFSCAGPPGFGYSSKLKAALAERLANVDLVHVHNVWGYSNHVAAQLCPRRKVPFVVSPHGMLDPHSLGRKAWKKSLYGTLKEFPSLRKADAMIFTHAEEERLARVACRDLPPGYVVSLGTGEPPTTDRSALAAEFLAQFPSTHRGPRVVFLGRLHEKKGLDLLLPAFAKVLSTHRQAQLVLAGPGEESYLKQLQGRSVALGLSDQIHFTGILHGNQKWAALAAADVFVLPSYQENFAIALVEALRVATPVICSRRINIWPDLVSADAIDVCELTVDSLSERIAFALSHPAQSHQQARRGAEYAARNFTWQKSAERLLGAYQTILSEAVLRQKPVGV